MYIFHIHIYTYIYIYIYICICIFEPTCNHPQIKIKDISSIREGLCVCVCAHLKMLVSSAVLGRKND